MKIACIGAGWYPEATGGLEKYVHGLTRALLVAGDSVDIFVTGEGNVEGSHGRVYPIGRLSQPLLKRMLSARSAFAQYFREPYDVINIHFALNAVSLIPFINRRTPRVLHFHGPWAAEARAEGGGALSASLKEALERFVYRRVDRCIVLSSAFKELLVGYGVERERITVIPMGIDCDAFRPADNRRETRAELGWPADKTVFFTARRLINRVGLGELVKAAKILRQAEHANFVIKIAGKGPLRDELARMIESLGVADCVELIGFVSDADLVRCYQAADVTVLPTQLLEGFGTIISESLACGTPVIVTPVGGMPEAVGALGEALITRSASPEHIAERMDAILRGTLRLPDRETCRLYALANFDWDTVSERVRTVFRGQSE
jgi:glycogen(starch) synthase